MGYRRRLSAADQAVFLVVWFWMQRTAQPISIGVSCLHAIRRGQTTRRTVPAVGVRGGQRDEGYRCRGDGGRGQWCRCRGGRRRRRILLAGCGRRRGSHIAGVGRPATI